VSPESGRGSFARAWRVLAVTLAAFVVLAALLVLALRIAIWQLPERSVGIRSWIERETHMRLEFTGMDARLRWWGPEVVLRDVRVLDQDATQALFETHEATVSLDLLGLFRTGKLVAGRVRFVGPEVTVVRLPDGRIRLLGLRERPTEQPFDLERLPGGRLDIVDATVRYEDRLTGHGPWVLERVQVSLERGHDAVDVTGSARLPEALGTDIDFEGRLRGPLDRLANLDARLSIRAKQVVLAGISEFLPAGTARLTGGTGPASLLVNASEGQLQQLRLTMDLTGVAIDLPARELPPIETVQISSPYRPDDAPPLSMSLVDMTSVEQPALALPRQARYSQLAGKLRLRREGRWWTFDATDLVLLRDASEPGDANMPSLRGRWRGNALSTFALEAHARRLRLADLWPLLLATAPASFDRWAGLDPSGEIRTLDLDLLRERAGSEPRFAASAEVADLGIRPVGDWPAVRGLTAVLSGTEQRGRLALASQSLSFEWPRMFRAPFELERADADMDWRREGDELIVSSSNAALALKGGHAEGSIEMRFARGSEYPQLVTEARVTGGDVRSVRDFLPIGRMQPRTYAWLDRAFAAGRLKEGQLSYRGPVHRFPFRQGEGDFSASATVEGVTLDYFEGFTPLSDATGTVTFHNASIQAQLRQGRAGDLRVTGGEFRLEDYSDPLLEIDAAGSGDLGTALAFLQHSPLGPTLGDLFMELSGSGALDFSVGLRLPTQRPEDSRYTVRTKFDSATVRWPILRAPVSRLSGDLEIREDAIVAKSLRGTYLDGPFELRATPVTPLQGFSMSVLLEAEGRAGGAQLPAVIGLPDGIRMSGATPWKLRGRLDRPEVSGRPWPTRFEMSSDLTGLAIDAPRPFAKRPTEARATRVVLDFPQPGRNDIRIETGAASAVLEFRRRDDERWILERGAARFDGRPVASPSRPGLHIAGDWPEFDLGEWLALRSAAPGGPTLSDWLGPVDVHLDRAQVIGFQFLDMTASMQPLDGAWRIQVTGPTADGVVTVPEDLSAGSPINLNMQRLVLQSRPAVDGASKPEEPTDPRDLPAVVVHAEDFSWEGRRFGRLDASVGRDARGLRLDRLATESPAMSIAGTGSWFMEDGAPHTRLDLDFSSTDLAAASRALGYRDAVAAEQARVHATINWSGGPDGDVLARMDGTVHLELDRGQLRSVKPGAGRILGLTSISALPRRLALDFRDVTDEGLAFDNVRGDFEIREGSAYTQNLLLKGASVDIGVVGRTGLANQDYDQTIVVSGNPSGPITIAGALAGGPVGAAGALLISQLFKGQLQGLARVYYRVTGSWDDPIVERISASAGGSVAASPTSENPTSENEPP
jgi:uncharacterized protein (TIGR02099 family)